MKKLYRDLEAAKVFFTALGAAQIAFTALLLLSLFHELAKDGGSAFGHPGSSMDESWEIAVPWLLLVILVGNIAVNHAFVIVMNYHFAKNTKYISDFPCDHSPGWSVAYYFIPVISLWKPYKSMKESWVVSARCLGQARSLNLPRLWWALFLSHAGILRFCFDGDNPRIALIMAGSALFIAYVSVTIPLFWSIVDRQNKAIAARLEREKDGQ